MKLKFLLEPLGDSIFQSGGQFHKKQNQTKKLEQKPKEGERQGHPADCFESFSPLRE